MVLALEYAGAVLDVRERSCDQQFYLAAIVERLRIFVVPDYKAVCSSSQSFAVRLGVGVKLPRVPAVFGRKLHFCAATVADHPRAVRARSRAIGAMVEMRLEEAKTEFGNLAVALLGAIEKKDGTYRLFHDGTHGTDVKLVSMRETN